MPHKKVDSWSVRKCAKACAKCGHEFADKEVLYSQLSHELGEYARHDFCRACRSKKDHGLSAWKTVFIVPPPSKEEVVKKENAEALLRKLIDDERDEDCNAIFILALMLERKKVLVEQGVQMLENGHKMRVYEHKKTNESFMVIDPELRLDELEHVQEQVVVLLGGKSRNAEPGKEAVQN